MLTFRRARTTARSRPKRLAADVTFAHLASAEPLRYSLCMPGPVDRVLEQFTFSRGATSTGLSQIRRPRRGPCALSMQFADPLAGFECRRVAFSTIGRVVTRIERPCSSQHLSSPFRSCHLPDSFLTFRVPAKDDCGLATGSVSKLLVRQRGRGAQPECPPVLLGQEAMAVPRVSS